MDMRDKIKAALEQKKLSRRGAARMANMKASSLCAYLKGHRELRTDTLARLLEVAGLATTTKKKRKRRKSARGYQRKATP